jgi:hypothetical protein
MQMCYATLNTDIAFSYLFVVYLTTLFIKSDYIESNKTVVHEIRIGKGLEGSSRGLILMNLAFA